MKINIRKRIWDIIFVVVIGLVLFVPSIRMPVISTIQRIFAGSPAPIKSEKRKDISTYDWELINLNGEVSNFSASEGKVTLVNFWATWCPPCVAELPSLQKLYDKYGDKMDFYFVSQEHTKVIERFLKNKNYHIPVYQPKTNYPKEFESDGLPTTFLLDKNGKIIIKEVGAKDWFTNKFLDSLEELLK